MYKISLLSGVLTLLSLFSYSQVKPLRLNEAWEQAFLTYPSLKEKESLIRANQYNALRVKREAIPSVELQLQNTYGTFNGSSGAFFPLQGIFNVNGNSLQHPGATTANAYGSIVISWEIFQFGEQKQRLKAANTLADKSKDVYAVDKLSVQASVTRLYFQTMYSTAYLDWAKNNANRVKQITEIAQSLSDAGIKPGADSLLAQSSYLGALAKVNEWDGNVSAAKANLAEYVPNLRDGEVLKSDFLFQNIIQSKPMMDSVEAHPFLQMLAQDVKYNYSLEKETEKSLLPSLSLLGGLATKGSGISNTGVNNNLDAGFQNMNNNYLVGLGLTWNISNLSVGAMRKKQLNQETSASQYRYEAEKIQLNTSLNSLNALITEQYKQVAKTDMAVKKAEEAYDLYFSRYENGLINLTELLQIQLLFQQSEKSNIDAHQQLWEQVISLAVTTNDFSYLSNQF